MSPTELRRAVLVLNSYTRWGHDELMEMAVEDLAGWLDVVPTVYAQK